MGVFEVNRGDNGAIVVNASTVSLGPIAQKIMGQMQGLNGGGNGPLDQVAAAMASWADSTQGPPDRRIKGLFDRDRYVNPQNAIEKIKVARDALEDDVIGGAADVTEALAIRGCSIKCRGSEPDSEDQEDVWNQLAGQWDLDSRLKEWWRTDFVDSQVVVATWWETQTFKSRLPTPKGQSSRKTYTINAPRHIDFIDTTRVAPVGVQMFRQERLAYIAEANEAWVIDEMLARRDGVPRQPSVALRRGGAYPRYGDRYAGTNAPNGGIDLVDPIIARLIVGRYYPGENERQKLTRDGVDVNNLFLFDDRYVFRATRTRTGSERFARVRLSSCFELLDLKHQLRQLERALLIGGAQYIVLITLGEKGTPTQQVELNHLRASVNTIGQVPVIVGDHRLNIEIVTPKVDLTLDGKRHDTIDVRLTARAYGTFASTGSDTSDPVKLARVIGSGIEGRRGGVVRSIQDNIFQAIRNNNPSVMTSRAELQVLPRTVALSFDSAWASFMLDLREANEISRDTVLGVVDLKQGDEAVERQREHDSGLDDLFETRVPHGPQGGGNQDPAADPAVDPAAQPGPRRTQRTTKQEQRSAGRRQGGRRNGGGRAPGTRQGQETADPRRSDTRPGRAALDLLTDYSDLEQLEPADAHAVLTTMSRDDLIAVAGALPEPMPMRHRARVSALVDHIIEMIEADQEPDHA